MPVIKCALKCLKMDLIIHPKWTPSAPISWLLSYISLLLFIALMVTKKKKNPFTFFVLKEKLFTSFPRVGLSSQGLREFTSLHMKQQKANGVDKEYPGSAQRQMDYFKGLEQSRGRGGVREECQHLAFAGSCHKVNRGLGRMVAP